MDAMAPNMPTPTTNDRAGADRERPGPEQPHRYQRLVAHPPSTNERGEPGRTDDVATRRRRRSPTQVRPPPLPATISTEPGRERACSALPVDAVVATDVRHAQSPG